MQTAMVKKLIHVISEYNISHVFPGKGCACWMTYESIIPCQKKTFNCRLQPKGKQAKMR